MADVPSGLMKSSSVVGDGAIQFGDQQIFVSPAVTKVEGHSLSAYASFFQEGEQADLPAPYAEVWVLLSGSLRVGDSDDTVTVQAGEFLLVPEQTPGVVEALEDAQLVCVSVPAH